MKSRSTELPRATNVGATKLWGTARALGCAILAATLLAVCNPAQASGFPPPPSGSYESDGIQITESGADPDDYFESSATEGGASLNVEDEISAGNYGEVWVSGSHTKQAVITYSWYWSSSDGLAPEPYKFNYTSDYNGNASSTATGASSASASGSYSDSVGLSASVNNSSDNQSLSTQSDQQDGEATISASVTMTLSGSIALSAKQGDATGNLSQSSSVTVEVE